LPAPTLENLLAVFRDDVAYFKDEPGSAGTMADLYEAVAKEKRIDIRIQQVDKVGMRVYYRIRGGDERDVSFKRLKNLLPT